MTIKTPLLSCRSLSFSFEGKQVLEQISLDLYPGEFVGLLGRNGAGKSTLLSCLSGLLPAKFEALTLKVKKNTLDISTASSKQVAQSLSFVPQEHQEMFPFNVLDVVVMGRTPFLSAFGAPGKKDIQLAKEVLSELQISHLSHRSFPSLSGGEKQLVLLARALVQSRKIIFLDEPTNHLDYKNRYQMLAQLRALSRENGSCILACLHDPNHALAFTDRVILLHQGKVLAQGSTSKELSPDSVSRLYGIAAHRSDGNRPGTIVPAFTHPSARGRVLLVSGHSGQGKTTLVQKIADETSGLSFGGILCPGTFKNSLRFQIHIRCLATGESAPFARRRDETCTGPFIFTPEGRALAERALDAATLENTDCVVVDEIGPLELEGEGYAPLIPPLLSLETPKHIWVVRPELIDAVQRRWLLKDPVLVNAADPDALEQIRNFLHPPKESHA